MRHFNTNKINLFYCYYKCMTNRITISYKNLHRKDILLE